MSTDRELLERAAKAAGIELQRCRLDDPMCQDFLLKIRSKTEDGVGWNPLADDGDALRLAVKLGIDVRVGQRNAVAWPNHDEFRVEALGDDPCAATRRAIVRAAAEIGGDQRAARGEKKE